VQCPYCSGDSSVTETRVTADGLRRRRVCTVCKRRFTTYEKLGAPALKVGKRDGSVEPFDTEKLITSLRRVCAHRNNVSDEDLKRIARDIEATLVDSGRKSISWSDLVSLALARLQNVDPVCAQPRGELHGRDRRGSLQSQQCLQPPPQLGLPLTDEGKNQRGGWAGPIRATPSIESPSSFSPKTNWLWARGVNNKTVRRCSARPSHRRPYASLVGE
jgi:transcriptional repressor NrdR